MESHPEEDVPHDIDPIQEAARINFTQLENTANLIQRIVTDQPDGEGVEISPHVLIGHDKEDTWMDDHKPALVQERTQTPVSVTLNLSPSYPIGIQGELFQGSLQIHGYSNDRLTREARSTLYAEHPELQELEGDIYWMNRERTVKTTDLPKEINDTRPHVDLGPGALIRRVIAELDPREYGHIGSLIQDLQRQLKEYIEQHPLQNQDDNA
jgi:hypothetical protein